MTLCLKYCMGLDRLRCPTYQRVKVEAIGLRIPMLAGTGLDLIIITYCIRGATCIK